MTNLYCEFETTNTKFNDREIYRCKYCGIKLLMDNPDTAKVLCFSKKEALNYLVNNKPDDSIDGLNSNTVVQEALKQIISYSKPIDFDPSSQMTPEEIAKITDQEPSLCSQEQINERLAICNKCEYYEDNACMLCGCVIVREANYRNKLALKHQSCPINKWESIK